MKKRVILNDFMMRNIGLLDMSSIRDHMRGSILAASIIVFCLLIGSAIRFTVASEGNSRFHGRFAYLDGLRAIAALLVLAAHTVQPMALSYGITEPLSISDNLGSLGVQIFFAISGFLFTAKVLNGSIARPAEFFMGRVRRIMPLYLVVVTVGLVLLVGLSDKKLRLYDAWRPFLLVYLTGVVDAPPVYQIAGNSVDKALGSIWTLQSEWLFYLTVPLLAFCFESKKTMAMTTVAVFAYAAATMDWNTEATWIFFIPGILAAFGKRYPLELGKGVRTALLIPIGVLAVFILTDSQAYRPMRLVEMFLLFSMIVLAEPKLLFGRVLKFMGEISYSIYLVHLPIAFVGSKLLDGHAKLLSPSNAAIMAVEYLFIAFVIFVAYLTHRFIEMPCIQGNKIHASASSALEYGTRLAPNAEFL